MRLIRTVSILSIVCAGLFLMAGCSHDDIPVSPNAATAAPARLAGEDPHAPPDRVKEGQQKGPK
jgi:hypothetical protein